MWPAEQCLDLLSKCKFLFLPWIQTLNSSNDKSWAEQFPSQYMIIPLLQPVVRFKGKKDFRPIHTYSGGVTPGTVKGEQCLHLIQRKRENGPISFLSLELASGILSGCAHLLSTEKSKWEVEASQYPVDWGWEKVQAGQENLKKRGTRQHYW